MNIHKVFLAIILIIAFTILIFTVSNKKRNDIVESLKIKNNKKKKKKKAAPEPEEIQQSIKQVLKPVVQEVVERAKKQGVYDEQLQTAANNVVSGALGCIKKEDIAILNEQRNLTEFMEAKAKEIAQLKEAAAAAVAKAKEKTNSEMIKLMSENATLKKKWMTAVGFATKRGCNRKNRKMKCL